MVKFDFEGPDAVTGNSVKDAVLAAIALAKPQLRDLRIQLELELDPKLPEVHDNCNLQLIVNRLIQTALSRSPMEGELQISVYQTNRGVEIEVADSSPTDNLPINAFSRNWERHIGGNDGESADTVPYLEMYHTRCPQGGQAWTLVLAPRKTCLRAVA